jgi:DNA polymerase-3 subunit epsilon
MIPEGDFRFIALDVETACSDAGSICQIGLACVAPDNSIHSFSTLVDPGTRFDAFNTQLHGIGPEHVVGAPRFREALGSLFPLLSRHHLVQHSSFDKRAVAASCLSCGLEAPDFRWSDSVQIARRAWPELKGNGGHGLGNLKKVLRLDFHHHDAGEDARAAAMVVLLAEAHLGKSFHEVISPPDRTTRFARSRPETRTAHLDGPLIGAVVAFTGSLSLSRNDAADLAARHGMDVRGTVTKATTHLVVGDQDLAVLAGHRTSSKHRKAEQMRAAGHPIRILCETEFLKLVASDGML